MNKHDYPLHSVAKSRLCLLTVALSFSHLVQAQESAFLKCADISAREARVLCLEQALDAATSKKTGNASASSNAAATNPPPKVLPSPPTQPRTTTPIASNTPTATAATPEPASPPAKQGGSKWDLFGLFEKSSEQSKAAEAAALEADTMHAKVAQLSQYKSNAWEITLDNGQVWRQVYSQSFLLRKGDDVKIYPTTWGEQFRLETVSGRGFLRVQRLR